MRLHEQIIILVAALNHVIQDIPPENIRELKRGLLDYIEKNAPHIGQEIQQTGELSDDIRQDILVHALEYLNLAGAVRGDDA